MEAGAPAPLWRNPFVIAFVVGCVTVTIADEGDGMNARELEQATTLFFTTKAQGSGLGLAIVKNFIEAHGGRVSVESWQGKGSKFRFTLPMKAELEQSVTRRTAAAPVP